MGDGGGVGGAAGRKERGEGSMNVGRVGVNPCIGCHPIPTRNTFTTAIV